MWEAEVVRPLQSTMGLSVPVFRKRCQVYFSAIRCGDLGTVYLSAPWVPREVTFLPSAAALGARPDKCTHLLQKKSVQVRAIAYIHRVNWTSDATRVIAPLA